MHILRQNHTGFFYYDRIKHLLLNTKLHIGYNKICLCIVTHTHTLLTPVLSSCNISLASSWSLTVLRWTSPQKSPNISKFSLAFNTDLPLRLTQTNPISWSTQVRTDKSHAIRYQCHTTSRTSHGLLSPSCFMGNRDGDGSHLLHGPVSPPCPTGIDWGTLLQTFSWVHSRQTTSSGNLRTEKFDIGSMTMNNASEGAGAEGSPLNSESGPQF